MQVIETKQDFEFWGGKCEIKEHFLDISARELVDYLLSCDYSEIPDEIEIKKDGHLYWVKCWEVLSTDRAEMKRFFKNRGV